MSYKVLALKYRPQTFAAVVGQQATLMALQHALDNNQVHHAYLFTGTRGVGKTTLARILAKSLNCERGVSSRPCDTCDMCTSIALGNNVDVIEIDAASRTKVEDTRDLLDNVPYAPVQARFKVYIIDEVHMLSNHSFNALLKTLEEPPEHVKFILATTDPQKLPVTILSRCLQFHLRSLTIEQIIQHLGAVLQQENINFEAAALVTIAECANGSMRDALSLLEQVIAFGERNVTAMAAQQILGTAIRAQILELLEKIIIADAKQAIKIVRDLAANNADFNQVLKLLQTLIHQLALVQIVPDGIVATVADSAQLVQLSTKVTALDLQLFYQAALLGVRDLPYAPDIVIGFEMIVLRMLAFQPVMVNEAKPISIPTPIPQAATTVRDWAQIIPQLNLPGLTKVLAEHCTIVSWQDDVVSLILHEAQKPLLNPKHIERIQAALRIYLKNNVKLNLTVGQVTAETPAAQGQRLQQAAQITAETNIRSDQHIQQLEQTFAAKILNIEVE